MSPKFCPPYRISWPLNTTVTTDFRPEAEFTLFLQITVKMYIDRMYTYYTKSTSPERMTGSDFWPEAPK